jgi:hypothetical protein
MSGYQEITYTMDSEVRRRGGLPNDVPRQTSEDSSIPRIARLMALAIRLEGLIRKQTIPDYASVARRGRVPRARMTQIMKLLDPAPDVQEQIRFCRLCRASTRETCGRLSAGSTGTSSGACFGNSRVVRA